MSLSNELMVSIDKLYMLNLMQKQTRKFEEKKTSCFIAIYGHSSICNSVLHFDGFDNFGIHNS